MTDSSVSVAVESTSIGSSPASLTSTDGESELPLCSSPARNSSAPSKFSSALSS
ncbi:MAG: hypothetical protein IJT06_04170 [Selenomonadaceae bacterium]|nr:hypothetical protein [Selenomonadaceae bacterium]